MAPAISVSLPLIDSISINARSSAIGSPSRFSVGMGEPYFPGRRIACVGHPVRGSGHSQERVRRATNGCVSASGWLLVSEAPQAAPPTGTLEQQRECAGPPSTAELGATVYASRHD